MTHCVQNYFNLVDRKKRLMATLTIMFLLFADKKATTCSLQPRGVLRQPSDPRGRRPPMLWSAVAENFRNTALGFRTKIMYTYLNCPIRATITAHPNLRDMITK
jgi:hypothetical protein